MNCKRFFLCLSAAALMNCAATVTSAEPAKETPTAAPAEPKLPAGWTMEDMQACIVAGTPGKMHERLAQGVGTWQGSCTMWMAPGAEPIKSDCTCTVSPLMDGRYFKAEMNGQMPGMGPYHGAGIVGFDNVSQEFVSCWIDNFSTGIMHGTGKLSADGKKMTTNYTMNCPIVKKAVSVREVETITGPNTKTLEMFGTDPKTGKEFQSMKIELTKK